MKGGFDSRHPLPFENPNVGAAVQEISCAAALFLKAEEFHYIEIKAKQRLIYYHFASSKNEIKFLSTEQLTETKTKAVGKCDKFENKGLAYSGTAQIAGPQQNRRRSNLEKTGIKKQDIEKYAEYLAEQEKSPNTVEKYLRDIRAFAVFAGIEKSGEAEVTKQTVIDYKCCLTEKYTAASTNSMLTAVNVFLKYCGMEKFCVKLLKIQQKSFRDEEKELSKNEYIRLVGAARRRKDLRLELIMKSICATGIRISELKFITKEAAQRGFAEIFGKGKLRRVILPSKLCKELLKYAKKKRISEGVLFRTRKGLPVDRTNVWKAMKSLCAEADVPKSKVFPHNLRHLFAVVFYRKEKDIVGLAEILGHSSINTTRIYTKESRKAYIGKVNRLGLVV